MNGNRGFSLVEMLVVTGVFTLILGALVELLLFGNLVWQSGSAQAHLHWNLRKVLDGVTREMAQGGAGTFRIEQAGQAVSFQVPQDNAVDEDEDLPRDPPMDPTRYTHRWVNGRREPETIFEMVVDPNNPSRLIVAGLEWSPRIRYRFDPAAGRLTREMNGVQTVLAGNLQQVEFRQISADVVETEAVPAAQEGSRTTTRRVVSGVKLRN